MKKIISSSDIKEPKYLVRRRLTLVNKLTAAKETEAGDINELINVDGKWFALPGKDYQGLRCYLLLTCFDILGQLTTEWADFYSWLGQKMNIDSQALTLAESEKDLSEPFKTLYHSYNREHATRNNFYYFINSVLSPLRRQELLNNIRVIKKDRLTDKVLRYPVSDSEKLKLLFDIRCSYMHNGIPLTAPGDQSLDISYEETLSENLNDYYLNVQWNPALLINLLEEILSKED